MKYKKGEQITSKYDVVVIGSGLAGMTAANKLAKDGQKVLLLESHFKLGGYATWFNRKQHVFDVSLHGFPVGMIKTCKKYWSKEIASSIFQLTRIRYVNPQFNIETDFTKENFTNILVDKFNISLEHAQKFFSTLENMNFYDDQQMTIGKLFEQFFPGREDIKRLLLEPITYANGSTLEDPAIAYGIVFSNFFSKGVYTFRGGTDLLIGKMEEELLKNGVDIQLSARVTQIEVKEKKTTAVWVGENRIETSAVLSNSNLLGTIFDLVGKDHFRPEFLNQAETVRINTSSCQVYMGIRKGETIPEIGDLIFYSEAELFNTDKILSKDITSQTFSIYYPHIRTQLDNQYAIVASSNARYEDWEDLNEKEYKERKQYLIDTALTALEKLLPGVRDKIDYLEAATPKTFQRYALHWKGSSFGTKFEGLDVSMNLHKEIDGLFHAGSVGIIMSGWLGAANYGVIQSHAINEYLDKV
jgi:phytoene dehydrogenase-like protein